MIAKAKVTIGIPVYNEEKHLRQTIKSALSQKLAHHGAKMSLSNLKEYSNF